MARHRVHPDDRASALRAGAEHLASGVPLRQEYRIIARDGRIVWVRDEATVLREEGEGPGFSQGILSDITDSKSAEETLRRQALIFENVHDAVLTIDLEGRILEINPGAEIMFGYSNGEARGRTPDFLSGVDMAATVLATVAREGRWSGEVPMPHKDGASRVAELVVVPLKDAGGRMLGTVGVLRDVTERKRSEEELRRTIEMLRASDQERRQLVSRLVSAREEEAQRIANAIHDDPIQKLSAAALRLGMLRKGAVGDQQSETIELGQQTRTIAYRIILEALSNVRRHAGAQNVTVSLADVDGGVYCGVKDDGRGIAPEELGVSRPGHMGTASMRERVEMAEGWIKIHSLPDQGTTVDFWLPGG